MRAWIERLGLELARAKDGGDPESVHRMRVAAGRLSVALEIAGRRALRDDLHALRRSAARLRDLDVWSARAESPAFAAWLAAERAAEHARWVDGLELARADALLRALTLVPEADVETLRDGVARLRRRVLRAGARVEVEPEDENGAGADASDEAGWHRLRRRLRRLRYALDWTGYDSKPVEHLQEVLGELNNLAVGRRLLEACPARASSSEEHAALSAAIAAQRASARAAWERGREEIEGG